MDYCLGDGDGSATMWSATELTVDTDDDGVFDAIGLDFDGDGRIDDALADLDGDGIADHLVLDLDDDGHAEASFTDDGSGTWAIGVDGRAGQMRWLGLDGNRDGLADRVFVGGDGGAGDAYVDTDADGRWDVKLSDADGDGAADAASQL